MRDNLKSSIVLWPDGKGEHKSLIKGCCGQFLILSKVYTFWLCEEALTFRRVSNKLTQTLLGRDRNGNHLDPGSTRSSQQGQIFKVGSFRRSLRCRGGWCTEICQKDGNHKGLPQLWPVLTFCLLCKEQPQPWLETIGNVREGLGFGQKQHLDQVGDIISKKKLSLDLFPGLRFLTTTGLAKSKHWEAARCAQIRCWLGFYSEEQTISHTWTFTFSCWRPCYK